MKNKKQYIFIVSFLIIFVTSLSIPFNAEGYNSKDRKYLAEVLTSEFFKSGQTVSCLTMDKNETTLNVVSMTSPNIDAILLAISAPDKMRRLKLYGFKKILVQGIGWKDGVSQGVQNERTISLK